MKKRVASARRNGNPAIDYIGDATKTAQAKDKGETR